MISQSFVGVVGLAAGIDIDSRGTGQHRLSALTSSDLGIADHSAWTGRHTMMMMYTDDFKQSIQ